MELTKYTMQWNRPLLDTMRTYEESADSIVPDAFPDILRISAAYGSVQLKDDSPQSGRVLISGSVQVTVLYVPENGGLRRLTVPVSFAHIEEGAGINESSQVFVSCQVVSASAQVMNSRKLSVSAILSVRCSVFAQEELSLTNGVSGGDDELELLSYTHTMTIPSASQRREFTIMDDLTVAESEQFEEVFAPCGDLRMTECRILNGKVVLKGECALHVMGMTSGQELGHMDCSMPFTQIFDAPDFSESQQLSVRFSLRHLDAELNEDGELSVGIGINVLLTAFSTHTISAISDIYHLKYPVKTETTPVVVPACRPISDMLCEASETIPVGMHVASIADSRAALDTILQDGDRTVLRMMATVLYRSDDGEYYSISRAVHVPIQLTERAEAVQVTGMVCRVSASVSGDNSVVLSLSGRCSLLCEAPLRISDVTAMELDSSSSPERLPVSVILRYVEKDERLWDIAKHYRTTVAAIRHANQLGEDAPLTSSRMLLIPVR